MPFATEAPRLCAAVLGAQLLHPTRTPVQKLDDLPRLLSDAPLGEVLTDAAYERTIPAGYAPHPCR